MEQENKVKPSRAKAEGEGQKPRRRRIVNYDPEKAQEENAEKQFSGTLADLALPEPVVVTKRDRDVFRRNIRFLIKQRGLKKAGIAKALEISEEWLRQVSRRGLSQVRKASVIPLERLRQFFRLDSVDELWSDHLADSLKKSERRAAEAAPYVRSKDWPYAKRIVELLQAGEYGFLRDLIDRLSEREAAIAGQSHQEGQREEDMASPEDMEKRLVRKQGGRQP